MTVAELIEVLAKLPPTLPVVMPSADEDFCVVAKADQDVAWVHGDDVQLTFETDPQGAPIVRLLGSRPDAYPPKDGTPLDDREGLMLALGL